jgi:sarcosine oxidase
VANRVDVAVVGAGVMGLAAARALAQARLEAVCFEQFAVGHARGSSHGTSRIFRLAYEDPEYVRLAREALPLWRQLEEETGEQLLHTTGSLDVGGDLARFRTALGEAGVEAEVVGADALRRRYPALRLPEHAALFHAEGGVLHADRARRALLRSAQVVERTRVLALEEERGGVRVRTDDGAVSAGAAIVAAGPWAPGLVDLPLEVTRETVAHYRLAATDALPTLIDHAPPRVPISLSGQAIYALPSPGLGLKAGLHRSGVPADPDEEGAPDSAVVNAVTHWVRERYALAGPEPALVETCLYTSTADQRFVVERRGRVVVCSACSGHGFKFAPALARRLLELAEEALES